MKRFGSTVISKEVDVDVEIDSSDVIEFLNECSDEEFRQIMKSINKNFSPDEKPPRSDGSLYDRVVDERLQEIKDRFTLEELDYISSHRNLRSS